LLRKARYSTKETSEFVSFRDPGGRTIVGPDRVFREVTRLGWAELECFLQSPLCRQLEGEGRVVSTKVISESETEQLRVVEHEKVPFVSYPFEWAPEMLQAAGCLTLELAERSLAHGFGLKDATAYNVLFRGSQPIFVDVLSFERRTPGDPIWIAYGQFVRNFLLPLLLDSRFGVSVQGTFLSNRDGSTPESVYSIAGTIGKLMPPILTLATIPTLLGRAMGPRSTVYRARTFTPEKAQFALDRLYRTVRKQLEAAAGKAERESTWISYERSCPYTLPQAIQKSNFVEMVLKLIKPRQVLDIGCNTGMFSQLASRLGSAVVAIDSDRAVVGALWKKARADNANILPLAVDIARPSPASGWRNLECKSFLSRCEGEFDCVLMLGLIHHLLITERVPLDSILDLAADLTSDGLIIEYIGPDDPMFCRLLRGRERLYESLSEHSFEQACRARFEIVDKSQLANCGRVVYFLRKRAGQTD
jgi:SAM-dependent methyltransferase